MNIEEFEFAELFFLTFVEAIDDVLCHYVSEDWDIKHFHGLLEDFT